MKKTKKSQKQAITHKGLGHHVRLAVVPHRANQFRPHLVRRSGIVVVLLLVVAAFCGSNWSASGSVLGVTVPITPTALLNDTNSQRHHHNEPGLSYNTSLAKAAYMKAQDMFKHQYWAHVSPDGTTPWYWFGQVDYDYAYAGENLAKNFPSADATVAAWMASPKHRENILSQNYTDVGFAVVDGRLDGKNTTLVVALYGETADSAVAGAAAAKQTDAPAMSGMSVMTQFGVSLQTMSASVLSSFVLLLVAAVVALAAHAYRRQLPKPIRESWRYHHGLYKAAGLMSVAVALVALYSGGQI